MYWSRAELKSQAKNVLRKHYWMVFLASLIAGILGGGSGSSVSFSFNYNYTVRGNTFLESLSIDPAIIAIIFVVAVIVVVFVTLFGIFVGNVVSVGLCRYLMEVRHGKTELSSIFWAFKGGRYFKVVKTMFLCNLYIFLWSLLLIVPGIIKTYQYYFIPYILAENPDIETKRALQLSKHMTHGEKFDIFVLGLSFFGWAFLAVITIIGMFFLAPYINSTIAELYALIRERSLRNGIAGPGELTGFYYPPPGYMNQPPEYGQYYQHPQGYVPQPGYSYQQYSYDSNYNQQPQYPPESPPQYPSSQQPYYPPTPPPQYPSSQQPYYPPVPPPQYPPAQPDSPQQDMQPPQQWQQPDSSAIDSKDDSGSSDQGS